MIQVETLLCRKSVISEKEAVCGSMAALEQQRDALQQQVENLKKETITANNDKSKVQTVYPQVQWFESRRIKVANV